MSWPDWDLSVHVTLVDYILHGVAMVTSGWLNVPLSVLQVLWRAVVKLAARLCFVRLRSF